MFFTDLKLFSFLFTAMSFLQVLTFKINKVHLEKKLSTEEIMLKESICRSEPALNQQISVLRATAVINLV